MRGRLRGIAGAWRERWGTAIHAVARRWLPARLLRWLALHRAPRSVDVELTTECNLACPLCPTHVVERRARTMSAAHVEGVLAAAPGLRVASFHVLGEPLRHPDLAAIVARFEASGVRTHFGTNGVELEGHVPDLVAAGLSSISVAIDGDGPQLYGRYRVGGDFERVVAGVRALVAARDQRGADRPRIQLQAVVFPYLEERVGEVEDFLWSLGADAVVLKEPSLFVDLEAWAAVQGSSSLRTVRLDGARARADAFVASLGPPSPNAAHSRTRPSRRPLREERLCPQLTRAHVLSDGRVVGCCVDVLGETAYGHLDDAPLPELWRSPARAELIQRFQERRLRLCTLCTL